MSIFMYICRPRNVYIHPQCAVIYVQKYQRKYLKKFKTFLFFSKFQRTHPVVFIYFLLNPSKHNTNEICIITFNAALLHVSAPGSHRQAK
jgi:hypothetical protein